MHFGVSAQEATRWSCCVLVRGMCCYGTCIKAFVKLYNQYLNERYITKCHTLPPSNGEGCIHGTSTREFMRQGGVHSWVNTFQQRFRTHSSWLLWGEWFLRECEHLQDKAFVAFRVVAHWFSFRDTCHANSNERYHRLQHHPFERTHICKHFRL